jgi:hypothetical protein
MSAGAAIAKDFASAKPGEKYRAPDGCVRRRPAAQPVATPAPTPTPKHRVAKSSALRAPLRGQKQVKRGQAFISPLAAALAKKYPAIQRVLPLRLGVLRDLVEGGVAQQTAMTFLQVWTTRKAYLLAVVAGGPRYRLDGTPDGEVEPKHRDHAAKKLEMYK